MVVVGGDGGRFTFIHISRNTPTAVNRTLVSVIFADVTQTSYDI